MKNLIDIKIIIASEEHLKYIDEINETIYNASLERGTGISRRTNEYISKKITEGKSIIALENETFAGFCYIENWSDKKFVVNSGLIVAKD